MVKLSRTCRQALAPPVDRLSISLSQVDDGTILPHLSSGVLAGAVAFVLRPDVSSRSLMYVFAQKAFYII